MWIHQGDWQLQEERECECPPSNHSSLLRCHYPHELSHSVDWLVIVGCSVSVTHEHPRIIIAHQSRSWFKHLRAKLSNSAWIQITFIQTHKCLPSFIHLLYFAIFFYFFIIIIFGSFGRQIFPSSSAFLAKLAFSGIIVHSLYFALVL